MKKKKSKVARINNAAAVGDDMAVNIRRQRLIALRMKWPPLTQVQLAIELGVGGHTVVDDIEWLRKNLNQTFFAENSAARASKAVAEMEVIAFHILSEIDMLKPIRAFAPERAAMYAKAMQALSERNRMMQECGMVDTVAQKIETSGPNGQPMVLDVMTTTIEQRIAALAGVAQVKNEVQK